MYNHKLEIISTYQSKIILFIFVLLIKFKRLSLFDEFLKENLGQS